MEEGRRRPVAVEIGAVRALMTENLVCAACQSRCRA